MVKRWLILLCLALFISFVIFSYFVAKERLVNTDFDTTVRVQNKLPRSVDYPFSLISIVGSSEVVAVMCIVLIVVLLIKRYWLAALAIFLLPLALFLELFGKITVEHPGPPHMFYRGMIDYNFPSHYVQSDYAYPSGHTIRLTFILAFLGTVALLKLKGGVRIVCLIACGGGVVLVGVSRVYLGEHWTSDVIGGFLLGSSIGILAALAIPIKKRVAAIKED